MRQDEFISASNMSKISIALGVLRTIVPDETKGGVTFIECDMLIQALAEIEERVALYTIDRLSN